MDNTAGPEKKVTSGGRQSGKKQAPEQRASARQSLWELIDEVMGDVPEAVLDCLPKDGSERHDYYLYGKREKKPRQS